MLPDILSFVDVETTGTSCAFDRIIEIGILRVEKNKVIKKFSTLINPLQSLDPFITSMTGISTQDLENAPTFYDVKDEVWDLLNDTTFVAHNVRFDYGFMRNEFKRLEISLSLKHFCTVKLARTLFPEFGKYNLDSIVENFNLQIKRRHRAFDDAKAIWDFYKKSQKLVAKEKFTKAILLALKRPTVPIHINIDKLDALPESPGIYIFYGDDNTPLYIGKSINIKNRVLSHFSNDHLSSVEMKISQTVKSIETKKTAGELGALLLESALIKKYQPLYNRLLRNSRKLIALTKTKGKNGYNCITQNYLEDIGVEHIDKIIGVFKSQKQLKENLEEIAKEHCLCHKLLNLEKTKKYCFSFHLGICKGACQQREHPLKYNLRFDEAFYKLKIKSWPFSSPILIREKGELEEGFLIDKWCCLGTLKDGYDEAVKTKGQYHFDYDTYKILKRYIYDKKNMSKITKMTNTDPQENIYNSIYT